MSKTKTMPAIYMARRCPKPTQAEVSGAISPLSYSITSMNAATYVLSGKSTTPNSLLT